MKGSLWALATVLLWGVAPLLEKAGLVKSQPLLAISVRSFAVSTLLLLTLLFTGQATSLKTLNWSSIVYIALGGILAAILGQYTFYSALKQMESSKLVPIVGSYPLVTLILAIIFFGEEVTAAKIMGAILIITGIYLLK